MHACVLGTCRRSPRHCTCRHRQHRCSWSSRRAIGISSDVGAPPHPQPLAVMHVTKTPTRRFGHSGGSFRTQVGGGGAAPWAAAAPGSLQGSAAPRQVPQQANSRLRIMHAPSSKRQAYIVGTGLILKSHVVADADGWHAEPWPVIRSATAGWRRLPAAIPERSHARASRAAPWPAAVRDAAADRIPSKRGHAGAPSLDGAAALCSAWGFPGPSSPAPTGVSRHKASPDLPYTYAVRIARRVNADRSCCSHWMPTSSCILFSELQ